MNVLRYRRRKKFSRNIIYNKHEHYIEYIHNNTSIIIFTGENSGENLPHLKLFQSIKSLKV